MTEYHAPNRRICAVCGYVLDEQDGRWFHGVGIADRPDVADHPAIPVRDTEVPAGHIRGQCDFCMAEDPRYILPARDFLLVAGSETGSSGDWAACADCAELLARNDWNGVVRRAVAGYRATRGAMTDREVTELKRMYRTLRENVTGSIYRLDEEADSER